MIDPLSTLVTLMRMKRTQGQPPCVLFLGDGAVPTGTPTLTDRLRKILSAQGQTDARDLALDQLWAHMNQVWPHLDPDEQIALLSQDEPLGPGYRALARLITAGYFCIILTTAFDRRLEKALQEVGFLADQTDKLVVECLSPKEISIALQRPGLPVKLIKLHGDLTADRFLLSFEEAFRFDKELKKELTRLLSADLVVVGHNPAYDEINRCFWSSQGVVYFVGRHPPDPQVDFLGRLPQVRPFNVIPAGCDDFFTQLADRLLTRPAPKVDVPRVRELCAVWSFPFYLPRFVPAALRPCFADLPHPPRKDDSRYEDYRRASHRDGGHLFLQGFGRLFDRGIPPSEYRLGWIPLDLTGPVSGVPFYPLLVERAWGLSFVGPPEFRKLFGVEARLRLHLYPQGIAVVTLVTRIHSRREGGDLDRLIHLLKYLSPTDRRKKAHFNAGPSGLKDVPIGQIVSVAVQRLAEALYRPGQVPLPTPASRQGRVLYIYRADPPLDPERHAIPVLALLNLHSAWRDMDVSGLGRKVTSDFGWYKGDWNLVQGSQVLLYTPTRPKERRVRRLFMWKVITAIELALGQKLLLERVPAELRAAQQKGNGGYQRHLLELAKDLQLFSRAALPSYQRKVYALVADRLHLAEDRAKLEKSLAWLEKETEEQKLGQLVEGQEHIRSSVDDLQEALRFRLDQQQGRIVTAIVEAINKGGVPGRELRPIMDSLKVLLEGLLSGTWSLPSDALSAEAYRLPQIIDAPHISIHHKLKITLPIIPLLLGYEGEVDLSSAIDLEQAWQRLREGWQRLIDRFAKNTAGRC